MILADWHWPTLCNTSVRGVGTLLSDSPFQTSPVCKESRNGIFLCLCPFSCLLSLPPALPICSCPSNYGCRDLEDFET